MTTSMPFCVLEKPYMVWGSDLREENRRFLDRIDAGLYYRTAHTLATGLEDLGESEAPVRDEQRDRERKDVSSLSRLLWHQGIETMVMLLGALMQAPGAVEAYFLKCRTEDAKALAEGLLDGDPPRYLRSTLIGDFSLNVLVRGIHDCATWPGSDKDLVASRFARVLRNLLAGYVDEEQRWEYNSIKHGLRASHGPFMLRVGIETTPGTPAPPEAMQTVGYSRDASFFGVARPVENAAGPEARMHFSIRMVSVTWSLETVLMDLQLISLLIGNIVSAIRIATGAPPGTVKFSKVADDAEFWEFYENRPHAGVPVSSFGAHVDARDISLLTGDQIKSTYRPREGGGRGL